MATNWTVSMPPSPVLPRPDAFVSLPPTQSVSPFQGVTIQFPPGIMPQAPPTADSFTRQFVMMPQPLPYGFQPTQPMPQYVMGQPILMPVSAPFSQMVMPPAATPLTAPTMATPVPATTPKPIAAPVNPPQTSALTGAETPPVQPVETPSPAGATAKPATTPLAETTPPKVDLLSKPEKPETGYKTPEERNRAILHDILDKGLDMYPQALKVIKPQYIEQLRQANDSQEFTTVLVDALLDTEMGKQLKASKKTLKTFNWLIKRFVRPFEERVIKALPTKMHRETALEVFKKLNEFFEFNLSTADQDKLDRALNAPYPRRKVIRPVFNPFDHDDLFAPRPNTRPRVIRLEDLLKEGI